VGSGALVVVALIPAGARADKTPPTRQECLTLHEKAQVLRKSASLLDARQVLRACADEACPALVREDCVELLGEVERLVPSVTFEVVVEGQDVTNAKVFDGDQLLTDGLNGVPHALNPGVHKFRAEVPGKPPLDLTEVVREGEQNRVIRLEYQAPQQHAQALPPAEPVERRPVPATAWVFGGLSVLAVGAGAVLGEIALSKRSQLTCSPFCTDADVTPVKTLSIAADASFGGAVVFAGLATVFFLTRPTLSLAPEKKPTVQPTAIILPGFQGFGLQGSF
jgi:hypothetical protein